MEIEDFLSSKTRVKIIKVLYELGELNIRRICQKVGSAYSIVKSNLEIMEELDIVQCKRHGRIRLCSLNNDNPKVKLLIRLIEVW